MRSKFNTWIVISEFRWFINWSRKDLIDVKTTKKQTNRFIYSSFLTLENAREREKITNSMSSLKQTLFFLCTKIMTNEIYFWFCSERILLKNVRSFSSTTRWLRSSKMSRAVPFKSLWKKKRKFILFLILKFRKD